MSTLRGTDSDGREWNGTRDGDEIYWESDDGLSGTETVDRSSDGTMRGKRTTGDVVPCDYDGRRWHGDCPPGEYKESEDTCFAAGTKVLTASGYHPIELIARGDSVLAYDSQSRQLVRRRVLSRKRHKAARIWEIHTDSGAIVATTPNHHVLSARGWTSVKALEPGDVLTRGFGSTTRVVSVLRTDRFEPVYNLVVDKENTFIVEGTVVHCFASFKRLQALWYRLSYGTWGFLRSFEYPQRLGPVRSQRSSSGEVPLRRPVD